MIYAIEAVGSLGSCDRKGHRHGLVKIGKARDPRKRLKELSTGSPHPLRLLASVDWPDEAERIFHAAFQKFRTNGEWFKPNPDLEGVINTMLCDKGATDEQKFNACMVILVEMLTGWRVDSDLDRSVCRAPIPPGPPLEIGRQLG